MRNKIIKICTLLILIALVFLPQQSIAQAPQKMSYQAVVRDASDALLANTVVGMQISILQSSASGTSVYVETHTPTTNANGLVSLEIGGGTVVSGDITSIDWSNGPYFIKTETDPTGGTSFSITGTTQLLSVPYALFAESTNPSNNTWNTTGNAGTNPATDFIGTTDDVPLKFRVNDIEAGHIGVVGDNSVFLGREAGLNDDGSNNQNTFLGTQAGQNNTTGSSNTATGYEAFLNNTTGEANTANGAGALQLNTTGDDNTATGTFALAGNTTGFSNTAIGFSALQSNTAGYNNTAIGRSALFANTTGDENTAIGHLSLSNNTIGDDNTAIGRFALRDNTTGDNNTATGISALSRNTTGLNNTAIGRLSLSNNTTGDENTAIGRSSLNNNTTGDNNTAIGRFAGSLGTDFDNRTAIGFDAQNTASNQVRIGNTAVTSIGGQVGWTTLSDGRFKTSLKENVKGLDFIMKLRPVTYQLDMNAIAKFLKTPDSLRSKNDERARAKVLQTGFVAQEVEQVAKKAGIVFSGVDAPKNEMSSPEIWLQVNN